MVLRASSKKTVSKGNLLKRARKNGLSALGFVDHRDNNTQDDGYASSHCRGGLNPLTSTSQGYANGKGNALKKVTLVNPLFSCVYTYMASSLSLHAPDLGDVWVLAYWKFFRALELHYGGASVSSKNLFIYLFPLDQTWSYFCSPKLFYRVTSNIITLVDKAFYKYIEWKRLCTKSLSSDRRVGPSYTSCIRFCKFSLCILYVPFLLMGIPDHPSSY